MGTSFIYQHRIPELRNPTPNALVKHVFPKPPVARAVPMTIRCSHKVAIRVFTPFEEKMRGPSPLSSYGFGDGDISTLGGIMGSKTTLARRGRFC